MQKSGRHVIEVDGLAQIDELDKVGTLFFCDAKQVQSPRQLERIMDWLDVGGNDIYAANSTAHEDDLLLQGFAVEVDWAEYDGDEDEGERRSLSETMREFNRQLEEGKSREEIAQSLAEDEISLTRVSFGEGIGELEVAFDNSRILRHPYIADSNDEDAPTPFSWSVSDFGAHMMQFEVGSGLLTIISDPRVWTSYQIDTHDHAYLLWLLSSEQGDFAVMRSVVQDTIWDLMKKNASELMIAGVLLILFWIWFSGYRFGRLLPRDDSRLRALGEHFSSVSHYLWHRKHAGYLITPLRQQVLRRASLTLAEFARADRGRQYQLLAQRCQLNAAAIARAFDESDFNEASFVQTVRLLKRIEQSL